MKARQFQQKRTSKASAVADNGSMNLESINPCVELEERLRFETLIADLSLQFVDLPAREVDREIQEFQRRICETLKLDLAGLWRWYDEGGGTFRLSHLYRNDEGPELPVPMNAREYFPWSQQELRAGRIVSFSSMNALPVEAVRDREIYSHFGVKSNLTLPLSMGRQAPIACLGFSTTRAEREWPSALVKRIQLIAQIFTNALARQRADKELHETDEINRVTFEQAAVGIAHVDIDGRWLRVNDKLCAILGYPREELLRLTFQDITYSDDLATDLEKVRQVLSGTIKTYAMEKRYIRKEGSVVWANLTVSLVRRATGEPLHFISVVEDITENKRAAEAFRESQTRLSVAADMAALGCYEVLLGKQSYFVDERFSEICGIPADQSGDRYPLDFWVQHLHPDDRPHLLDLRQQLHDGRIDRIQVEYRYLHPAKGERWIHHVGGVTQRNAGGHAVRTFGVVRDITAQKQAEREATELRDNLMHLTRVNTMTVLSGSLAHELNQPLGIILTNAQAAQDMLLQQPPDLAELQAVLSSIVAADRRAGDVIGQLRTWLKRGKVLLRPISLNEVIEQVLRLIHADLIGRNIGVVRELAPDLPMVSGDRVQLQQLVLNLVINGAEAMTANKPGARCICVRTQLNGDRVVASVQDEGCGLPADRDRLFQPFFTTKPQGLGMGLAICRSIAAAHNGRLWAEPGLERGAVFHVELPIADCTENI